MHPLISKRIETTPTVVFLTLALFSPMTLEAADFPPISQQHQELKAVAWEPGASAVILHRNAELRFRDLSRQANSRLQIDLRIKILTDEGLDHGVVEIPHSRHFRLGSLEGRTVTAAGDIVPLPEDAVFRERRSKSSRIFVTKAAFPAVEVGAILDLRTELFWDSFYYLEPWYFAQDLPVLHSKISYLKPDNLAIKTWARQIGTQEMQVETGQSPHGARLDIWMDGIGALPKEPYSFPAADLSSRFMVIPVNVISSATHIPLLADWRTVCRLFESEIYKGFRKGGRSEIKKRAKALAAGSGDKRETVRRILALVRDDIVTTDSGRGIWVDGDRDAGDLLANHEGTAAEKTLLLQALLDAAKVETQLLWVADRRHGRIDPEVANPDWFSGMILSADLGGERLFLDPEDSGNALGMLPYYLENTFAINCGERKPAGFQLPVAPAENNRRRAHLEMRLDEHGSWQGTGSLELSGHAAWRQLGVYDDGEAAAEGWSERLDGSFEGFDLADFVVEEDLPSQRVLVRWAMKQRAEDVLGDEASLRPSRPLQRNQPFSLPPDRRRTPVQMSFALRDQVELEISWPEGWKTEVLPATVSHGSSAGGYQVTVEVDEAERRLSYRRQFDQLQYEFLGHEAYSALRELYETAFKNDGQDLVLVRD